MIALSLSTPVQSNDSKIIRFVDNTGEYDINNNPTGWGSPNASMVDVIASSSTTADKYHLLLELIVTTSNNTETTYTVDLFNLAGPFADTDDLIFDITSASLGIEGDYLPDGWYNITYKILNASDSSLVDSYNIEILVDGIVSKAVYTSLRTVPYSTDFERYIHDIDEWDDLLNPLYHYSLLQGLRADVTTAKKEEMLSILYSLERNLNL